MWIVEAQIVCHNVANAVSRNGCSKINMKKKSQVELEHHKEEILYDTVLVLIWREDLV